MSRRFRWSDFVAAEKWVDRRVRDLETDIAPFIFACVLGCAALAEPWRRLLAYAAMGVIMLRCSQLEAPPPLIAPGLIRALDPRDAGLRRLARGGFQRVCRVAIQAPGFTLSWLTLGGIAAFG